MQDWDGIDLNLAPGRGPVAEGGELNAAAVLAAYRAGVFPWYSEGEPVSWWCPHPRFILLPSQLRVTDSLRKTERRPEWEVTVDREFEGVMRACGEAPRPGQDGTWITEAMVSAYVDLHRQGHAHSVEVRRDGELVGGLYGVAIGRMFCGESMFHRRTDASKVGFVRLVRRLEACGFGLIDCQMPTRHLASFGAAAISRASFLRAVQALRDLPPEGAPWASPLSPAS